MQELHSDGTYGEVVTKTWKKRKPTTTVKEMQFADDNQLLVVQKTERVDGTPASPPPATPTPPPLPPAGMVLKNVAKKSTAKPGSDYGFSFYGTKPDYGDLKKITTTFKINNADVTRTVEQFSHIFNLLPNVVVEDCMKKPKKTDM